MERPGPTQHDQLHLGDGVPHALVGAQAIPGLQVGVEAIVSRPAALRAHRIDSSLACEDRSGRKCTFPRARVRLREYRDGCDTTQRSNRTQSQPAPRTLLRRDRARARRTESSKAGDDLAAREESGSAPGIFPENLIERSGVEIRLAHDLVDDRYEFPPMRRRVEFLSRLSDRELRHRRQPPDCKIAYCIVGGIMDEQTVRSLNAINQDLLPRECCGVRSSLGRHPGPAGRDCYRTFGKFAERRLRRRSGCSTWGAGMVGLAHFWRIDCPPPNCRLAESTTAGSTRVHGADFPRKGTRPSLRRRRVLPNGHPGD